MFGATSLRASSFQCSTQALIVTLVIVAGITSGCGSNGSSMTTPKFVGNTNVTVMVTSTANDQVTNFNLQFETLTLTNQAGKAVTLLSSTQPSEFMHVNGGTEPLMTASIPQDIYTSATVTLGGAEFVVFRKIQMGDSCSPIIPPSTRVPSLIWLHRSRLQAAAWCFP